MRFFRVAIGFFVSMFITMSSMTFADEHSVYNPEIFISILDVGEGGNDASLISVEQIKINQVQKYQDEYGLKYIKLAHAKESSLRLKQYEANMMNKNFESVFRLG